MSYTRSAFKTVLQYIVLVEIPKGKLTSIFLSVQTQKRNNKLIK
ncbi:hypothetical protein A5888_000003 [Enterococcus sp. 9E7_DIV0242]|uniref:Uncharacterized protein n=1 Tax=Candidatus Enterococcus clewellii TaxID=1834193 RepID=A0A242KAP8_9ENTE|nr:hypothetical protein A5888_000055 [Enterococcus sp. 9E7_DIV0242]